MKEAILTCIVFAFLNALPGVCSGQVFSKNRGYLTPFALYDPENPSLRLGYERVFDNKISLLAGAGWIYTLYDRDSMYAEYSKNRGFVYCLELRKYSRKVPLYFGLRYSHLRSDNTRVYSFPDSTKRYSAGFSKALRMEKNIMALQVVGGFAFELDKGFVMDLELGLGVAKRNVDLQDHPESWGSPVFDRNIRADISNRDHKGWFIPYPYLQLHLGWGFNG